MRGGLRCYYGLASHQRQSITSVPCTCCHPRRGSRHGSGRHYVAVLAAALTGLAARFGPPEPRRPRRRDAIRETPHSARRLRDSKAYPLARPCSLGIHRGSRGYGFTSAARGNDALFGRRRSFQTAFMPAVLGLFRVRRWATFTGARAARCICVSRRTSTARGCLSRLHPSSSAAGASWFVVAGAWGASRGWGGCRGYLGRRRPLQPVTGAVAGCGVGAQCNH